MKKYGGNKMRKLISGALVVISVLVLSPTGASAEWRQDNSGWWYSEGNSYAKGWRDINGKTYYFDSNGYMKTGWVQDNYYETWHYFYQDGAMAHGTVIDGYELDEDGTWIKPSKEAEEARNLILKEDSNYISKMNAAYGAKLTKRYFEGNINKFIANDKWNLPVEDVYVFSLTGSYNDEYCGYMVGKTSKNVYCVPHQGGLSIYQIKNNEIVKTYKWLDSNGYDGNWRNLDKDK
jgi:FOG: Glucan-binding domain (YG repeat)